MAYTTNKGTSGTVGLHDTTYTPADYEALYRSANFTLPASSDSSNMTCLTGLDVAILSSEDNPYRNYFWNVGVWYNSKIPKCFEGASVSEEDDFDSDEDDFDSTDDVSDWYVENFYDDQWDEEALDLEEEDNKDGAYQKILNSVANFWMTNIWNDAYSQKKIGAAITTFIFASLF